MLNSEDLYLDQFSNYNTDRNSSSYNNLSYDETPEPQVEDEVPNQNIHPVDLFFYSMAETTKALPLVYQSEIKRRVLEIVIKAEEENMNRVKSHK